MSKVEVALQTIHFIEDHLQEKLSLQDLADHAGFSQYHFVRLFTKTTGYSPYDYYLSRKLTKAVEHLSESHCKVIDAALEYGFNSPESFTRACLSVFGYSPSTLRKKVQSNQFIGVYELKKDFLDYIQKRELSPPQLLDMPELSLYGIGYLSESDQDYMKIPRQLEDFFRTYLDQGESVYKLRIKTKSGEPENIRFLGIHSELSHLMTKRLPATTYLAFDLYADESQLQNYIQSYYLPGSPYQLALPYSIELLRHEHGTLYLPVSLR
ncbi:MAG: helix-turn-helix transcriptional regulator [Vallitaleaceae bacterium]|nr:helix-turn-helix transcriptional regulator [Vallitaleaceae bacterium]